MAQQGVLLDEDQFHCSICLDLVKDPVALPCGHSYCSSCIEGCWDQDEQKGVYSCPQCRRSFTPRPALMRNIMLAEVVEKLNAEAEGGAQAAPSELTPAGSESLTCDLCTGTRKRSAVMSCLVCQVSYCETHLRPHYRVPGLKKHTLVKSTRCGLEERMCSSHGKLLEVFCRTEQQCICYLCTMDAHKGHDTVSAAVERAEKQSKLSLSQQQVQQRVQEREKDLKDVQQAVWSLLRSGQAAEQDSDRIFTKLIYSIERRRTEVKELIRAQQMAAVSKAGEVVKRLEKEIAELRKRDAEIEQLSHIEDHIHFLQSYQSVSVSSDLPSVSVPSLHYFSDVTKAVSRLREKLEDVIKGEWSSISLTVSLVDVLNVPKPRRTRAHFLHYPCPLTLDPNTAHRHLSLSGENRKVTCSLKIHSYPHHPDRFTSHAQVLCREALSGRCYLDVEWRGRVYIAVSYKDISRRDSSSWFGNNNMSWSLRCSRGGYTFSHNNVVTTVSGPQSSRVRVYLDHEAGSLSFYSVSDIETLLHKVQTTFTQPLYPGFTLWDDNDCAEISKLW